MPDVGFVVAYRGRWFASSALRAA